jgi:hypothetical protein
MKKIVYKEPGAGIVILTVAAKENLAKYIPQVADMTDDEYYDFIIKKDVPEEAQDTVKLMDDKDFPATREHRDEWDFSTDGKKVSPDPVKVAVKLAKQDEERQANVDIFTKMGISEQEAEKILGARVKK